MEEYVSALAERVYQLADILKVDYVEIDGRVGWRNLLRKHGFIMERATFTLDLRASNTTLH